LRDNWYKRKLKTKEKLAYLKNLHYVKHARKKYPKKIRIYIVMLMI
jgi:hypothetical protein